MDKLSGGTNMTVTNSSVVDRWPLNERGLFGEHLELKILVPAVLGVVCVLGLACCLTAMGILVYCAHRGKVSLINSLIFNLMFADGLVLALAAPLHAAAYSEARWRPGWAVCKTQDWFLQSCMAAKSFTVAIMAKACYRYVSSPGKQVGIRIGSILVVLVSTWTSACSVTMPHWLFATLQRDERRGLEVCAMAVPPQAGGFMSAYVKAYPLAVYCAPLSVALLYFWKSYGRCQRRSSKTQNLRAQIRSRRLTLMLFSLTVAMAILWLPQWVVWVWERHLAERESQEEEEGAVARPYLLHPPPLLLSLSSQLLAFSLSLVNPVIVLLLSEEFREGVRGLFRRVTFRKRHPPKPGPHTPTSQRSPRPRPESSSLTSHHSPRGDRDRAPRSGSGHGPRREAQPQVEQSARGRGEDADRESLRDGIVLPDVEQFWHERETGSLADENDPVPWEQQDRRGRK